MVIHWRYSHHKIRTLCFNLLIKSAYELYPTPPPQKRDFVFIYMTRIYTAYTPEMTSQFELIISSKVWHRLRSRLTNMLLSQTSYLHHKLRQYLHVVVLWGTSWFGWARSVWLWGEHSRPFSLSFSDLQV